MSDIEYTSTHDEATPVLIVGGSLVGLSMSLFLSSHGISSLLVERHANISPHPRAFNFNMRTMELFRSVGVEGAVRRKAPPHFQNSSILQAQSLLGRELSCISQDTTTSTISVASGCIIGQDALEPVLREHAEKLGGDLRFSTVLLSYEQDESGVSALIRNRVTGVESRVRARYLIAADGNRSMIRQSLGTRKHGPGSLGHQLSILFDADLTVPLRGRRIAVCFVHNPQVRKGTSIVFARNGQGYALFTPYFPQQGEREEDFDSERGIEQIRGAVGIPDLPVKILAVRPWEVAVWVAERFQYDNIFLVGDSAHVNPPAGAFGANIGIADAYNLAWKLALVLKEVASPKLLETYTQERHPVVRHTAEEAFAMFQRFTAPAALKNPHPIDYDTIAFGYRYHSATIDTEGADEQDAWYEDPRQPTGTPGTHAAHLVLQRDGADFSTLDLFGQNFVLLTGSDGDAWRVAAQQAASRLGLTLDIYKIDHQGDLADPQNSFSDAYGITASGATLVRPDGFIGWRSQTLAEQPAAALEAALARLLSSTSISA